MQRTKQTNTNNYTFFCDDPGPNVQVSNGASGWVDPILIITKQGHQLPLLVATLVAGGVVQGNAIQCRLKVEDRIVMISIFNLQVSFLESSVALVRHHAEGCPGVRLPGGEHKAVHLLVTETGDRC